MHPLKSHRYVSTDGPSDPDDCQDLHEPPSSIENKRWAAAPGAAAEPPSGGDGSPTQSQKDAPLAERVTRHSDRNESVSGIAK
jgi:hypothetical protein